MTTGTGDVTVGADVVAGNDVIVSAGEGTITFMQDVSGGNNVTVTTGTGNIVSEGTASAGNDLTMSAQEGNINSNAATAGNDVTLRTGKGNITSSTLEAARNAVIATDAGDITSGTAIVGNDIMLTTGKGDVTTKNTTAGHDIAIKNGNGITTANTMTAGNHIDVANGDGKVIVGTADGMSVSLTNAGREGSVTAEKVLVDAMGNGNGTGKEDVYLGGSYITVENVIKKDGTSPMTISTAGASEGKPVKDISLGTRNADGSYDGGIRSDTGTVIQEIWTDTGMIYMADSGDLHVSKVLANDKVHVANDKVDLAVYGRTPTHDGERIVYWDNPETKNPANDLETWNNRDYYGAGRWIWLDLNGDGKVRVDGGEMIDYNYYRNLYGKYPSLTDLMREELDDKLKKGGVIYYDRYGLIRYELQPVRNATDEEIAAE